jgi:hypothetical protein
MYLNNEIYSTKLQRSVIQKYNRYHMSQHTPHNRVGLHKIQQSSIPPVMISLINYETRERSSLFFVYTVKLSRAMN